MPISGGIASREAVPGGWNLQSGLDRFVASLGRVGVNSAGVGLGGIDVVAIGDSILKGTGSTEYWRDGFMHRLKVLLQRRYNPANVVGGYGFVPFSDGSASFATGTTGTTNFQISTFTAEIDYSDGGSGSGGRSTAIYQNAVDSGSSQRLNLYRLDQTIADSEGRRLKVDGLDLICGTDPALGTLSIDIGTASGTTPNRGAGSPTGSVNQASATSYGNRYTISGITGKSAYTDLRVCVRAPASSTTRISADGLVLYYQDRTCGVRVHDLSNSGSASGSYPEGALVASVDSFGTGVGGGANQTSLYILDHLINDCQAAVSLTTFRANIAALIDRCLSRPSSPSVLYMIPPRITTVPESTWAQYVDAVYQVCSSRAHVAILDFARAIGTATAGDGVHNSDLTQAQMAELTYRALTA